MALGRMTKLKDFLFRHEELFRRSLLLAILLALPAIIALPSGAATVVSVLVFRPLIVPNSRLSKKYCTGPDTRKGDLTCRTGASPAPIAGDSLRRQR